MEIDTGSTVIVLPESTYRSISTEPVQESTIKSCTYSGQQLEVKGTAVCKVEYDDKIYRLPVIVLGAMDQFYWAASGYITFLCNGLSYFIMF